MVEFVSSGHLLLSGDGFAKPVYLCARGSNWDGRLAHTARRSVPPGRAQREPQGYAGLTRDGSGLGF